MELGKQIYELRKKANLSQEQLAEKVGVSRQTISKWELGETAPDIKQAQVLSQVFGVSLDELTGNDTKEVIYEKVSNTEKLAGLIIKIIKIWGIIILACLIIAVIGIILFGYVREEGSVEFENNVEKVTFTEVVGEETYRCQQSAPVSDLQRCCRDLRLLRCRRWQPQFPSGPQPFRSPSGSENSARCRRCRP